MLVMISETRDQRARVSHAPTEGVVDNRGSIPLSLQPYRKPFSRSINTWVVAWGDKSWNIVFLCLIEARYFEAGT